MAATYYSCPTYTNTRPKSFLHHSNDHYTRSISSNLQSSHIRIQLKSSPKRLLWKNDHLLSSRIRRANSGKCKSGDNEEGIIGGDVVVIKEHEDIEYRYKVVGLVALVMCLMNAVRIVMSVAVVPLSHSHGWTTSFVGIVQSSSLWGYIVSSVIGGAMADELGGATVMAWGVSLCSLATLLTPWAADISAPCLLAVRAFFGLAQGVVIPSMNVILARWFPSHERARAVGISMAGFQLGNVLGLCVTPPLMSLTGISGPFVLFSSLGLLWMMAWVYGVTNDPRDSRFTSKSEQLLIQAGKANVSVSNSKVPSVGVLLSKWPSWAVILANVTNNWGYFVLLSWMPIYFTTVLDVNLKEAAWFSAVPWGVMAISSYIAGAASDYLIKTGYAVISVRKIMQSIGFIGPGLSLLCLNYASTPSVASVILTLALSLSSFSQAGYLLNIQDVAPQSAGLLHGISNGVGTLAAIISTVGAGYFVEWLGSFRAFLTLTSILYFATTIFYNIYASGERVV